MKTINKLWILILALMLLVPVGLILPAHFNSGSAWGEWSADEIRALIGYIPQGLKRLLSIWSSPLPDYAFKNWEGKGLLHLSIAYVISAAAGILFIIGIAFLLGKFLTGKGKAR